jgi:lysophospholipase L1-like esterase
MNIFNAAREPLMTLNHRPSLMLSISVIACTLLVVGCASSSKEIPVTPNPFSVDGSGGSDNVRVNTLRAFGDSYTAEDYSQATGTTNWTRQLSSMVPTDSIQNYAVGGAKAKSGEYHSFANQISNWEQRNSAITSQDLTVVYFGYNDIGDGNTAASYAQSRADYQQGVNRLVAQGAASDKNRIFVTRIHDWSKNPGTNSETAGAVKDWVNFVADVANANPNIIAVDLFTVFNRVFEDPAKFGIINVTDANTARSSSDFLYYDSIHFGNKGQEIIARTYRHYLTRAWNWANALNAGGSAASQLNQDINNNVLSLNNSKAVGANNNLRLVPLLSSNLRANSPTSSENPSFGLAFDIKTKSENGLNDGRFGLALSNSDQRFDQINGEQLSSALRSQSAALYWMQPQGAFHYSAQFSNSQHSFSQSGHDELLVRSINNQRNGQTWSLEGALRYTVAAGNARFTPWVSINQQRSSLNGGKDQSIYTTDVQYGKINSHQVLGNLGIDFASQPIYLTGNTRISWGGGIAHQQTLKQNNIQVTLKEDIYGGTTFREVLVNPRVNKTQVSLTTQADINKRLRMQASWSVDPANQQDQTLNISTVLPF